jgi:predicted ATPase
LYSLASEVEAYNGNYERVVLYIEEVINKGKCVEDKLRAYAALIRSMSQQHDLEAATSVGIDVLNQLGENIQKPTNKSTVVKLMTKIQSLLKGKSNYEIINLPTINDPIQSAVIEILLLVFMISYQARSPYTPILALRALELSLKYGLDESSCVAFATYATLLCGIEGNTEEARRYGEIAITLAESGSYREYKPIVYYIFGSCVSHWFVPIRDTYNDLLYSSKLSMEISDAEIGILAKTMKCIHSLFCGTNLYTIRDELEHCINTAALYHKKSTRILCTMTKQFIECYMGKDVRNPAHFDGMSAHFREIERDCKKAHNKGWLIVLHFYCMDLAYSFGEYDLAAKMATLCEDESFCSLYINNEIVYKEGLNAVVMVRRGIDKRKYLKIANNSLVKLKKWSKDSPVTYLHKQLLLTAEINSISNGNKCEKVYPIYMAAMSHAQNFEYINEYALIVERYADYRLLCGDEVIATELYYQSMELYNKWGATAKQNNIRDFLSSIANT